MTSRSLLIAVVAFFAAACSPDSNAAGSLLPDGEGGVGGTGDSGHSGLAAGSGSAGAVSSGQTGSISGTGAAEDPCTEDSCTDDLEKHLSAVLSPIHALPRPSSVECADVIREGLQGSTCTCLFGDGGSIGLGPVGIECAWYGRAGACVWGAAEITACDPEDLEPCAAACDEVVDRLAAESALEIPFVVRRAVCVEGECKGVAEVDGRCFEGPRVNWKKAYDCQASDQEILEGTAAPAPLCGQEPATSCGPVDDDDAGGP